MGNAGFAESLANRSRGMTAMPISLLPDRIEKTLSMCSEWLGRPGEGICRLISLRMPVLPRTNSLFQRGHHGLGKTSTDRMSAGFVQQAEKLWILPSAIPNAKHHYPIRDVFFLRC